MLVSLIILLVLLLGFRYGFKRGLVQTLLSILGYLVVLGLALYFSGGVGGFLLKYLPNLDQQVGNGETITRLFYRILAFWIIAIVGGIAFRVVTRTFTSITKLPLVSQLNSLAGGIVWLAVAYVLTFFVLLLLATSPTSPVQNSLSSSPVAQFMLKETPIFSQRVWNEWVK
ncbi:hypothetical protein LPAF129_15350 [Ligilactobacillus pabuli]|uniref:CvpA family protein n=1 Tax=Ligilactobacillus pabuli TaxID=2886039 RepID=A0ABQ5JIB6_9LACO|nr:CvpA family protein [Ligilactobacillus pabuli]GKS81849.1 hypothetical protein LPAF129_15350 [Ligilactobacillus pabuli]HIW88333.1 CvpA family protein [Candidatus Ligilactobacillus excrementipullorum]